MARAEKGAESCRWASSRSPGAQIGSAPMPPLSRLALGPPQADDGHSPPPAEWRHGEVPPPTVELGRRLNYSAFGRALAWATPLQRLASLPAAPVRTADMERSWTEKPAGRPLAELPDPRCRVPGSSGTPHRNSAARRKRCLAQHHAIATSGLQSRHPRAGFREQSDRTHAIVPSRGAPASPRLSHRRRNSTHQRRNGSLTPWAKRR